MRLISFVGRIETMKSFYAPSQSARNGMKNDKKGRRQTSLPRGQYLLLPTRFYRLLAIIDQRVNAKLFSCYRIPQAQPDGRSRNIRTAKASLRFRPAAQRGKPFASSVSISQTLLIKLGTMGGVNKELQILTISTFSSLTLRNDHSFVIDPSPGEATQICKPSKHEAV
jgi:hypothetical protein